MAMKLYKVFQMLAKCFQQVTDFLAIVLWTLIPVLVALECTDFGAVLVWSVVVSVVEMTVDVPVVETVDAECR